VGLSGKRETLETQRMGRPYLRRTGFVQGGVNGEEVHLTEEITGEREGQDKGKCGVEK